MRLLDGAGEGEGGGADPAWHAGGVWPIPDNRSAMEEALSFRTPVCKKSLSDPGRVRIHRHDIFPISQV